MKDNSRIYAHEIVPAIDLARKMAGKSQTVLAEGADHHQYFVKWMYSPRSAIAVSLEALRNSVYELMGLPVASWRTIEISDRLIDARRDMWPISSGMAVRPPAGVHFASRAVRDSVEGFERSHSRAAGAQGSLHLYAAIFVLKRTAAGH